MVGFNVSSIIDSVIMFVFIVLGIALVTIIGVIFWLKKQYDKNVIVKEVTNEGKVLHFTKAREIIKKDGQMYWKLAWKKVKMPIPPPECIEIDHKGKKWLVIYLTPTKEVVFATDNNSKQSLLSKLGIKKERDSIIWSVDNNKKVENIAPFPTNQRAFYVSQIKKAQQDSQFSISKNVPVIIGAAAIIIIIVVVLLKLPDAINAMNETAKTMEKVSEQNLQLYKEMTGKQHISSTSDNVEQTPPN